MNHLELRPATEADHAAITALFEATWLYEAYPSTPRTKSEVGPFIWQTPMSAQWVITANDVVIAHAAVQPAVGHAYEKEFSQALCLPAAQIDVLCRLAVHPNWRRQGLAAQLLATVRQNRHLAFDSLAARSNATALYRALGFTQAMTVVESHPLGQLEKLLWVEPTRQHAAV